MATNKGRFALSYLAAALVAAPLCAGRPVPVVQAQMDQVQNITASLGADHAFSLFSSQRDDLGQSHAHFQQSYKGVKVFGGDVIIHQDARGRALAPTMAAYRDINLNVTPALEHSEALAIAHQAMAPKAAYKINPDVELVVYPLTTLVKIGPGTDATAYEYQPVRYHLAYVVTAKVESDLQTSHMKYIIDANTGAILNSYNDLHTTAAVGTGNSQYSGVVSLNTNSVTSGFEMRDMTRGSGGTFGNNVVTNLNHATSGNGTIYTDADNTWGDGNNYTGSSTSTTGATGQTAAVDAAFGIQATWDMYNYVLGRNGIDGTGRATYTRVHYSTSYDNAFWDDTCFCMTFGDGSSFKSLESVDVDGHEMSHGVCANNGHGGLNYSGESGGLNESNSDVMGTMVEFYDLGGGEAAHATTIPATGGNWTMGEQLETPSFPTPLRYLYKPSKDGASPDAWSSSIGTKDVHYSSGPGNRQFYFMSQGSSATSSSDFYSSYLPGGMTGVGNDHTARVHYRALTTYYVATETYAQARAAHISAAKDLYGAGSAEEQAVWNSFAAINVGAKWTGTGTAPAITTQPANVTVTAPATATFSVVASGTAPLTYQWFKGTTAISGATAASYTTPATSSADNATTFHVTVTNSAGSATSNNATLTVNSTPTAPAITGQPANATVNAGSTATFSVTASGTAPMTYQWFKGTTAISGATSASYTTPATVIGDSGSTFHVTVTNSVGSATSNNATLTVNPISGGTFPEVESNNTIGTANAVGASFTAIQGNLTTTTDVDYFGLTLAAGQKVTINMSGPSGPDWDLYLKNSAGTTLTSSTGSTTTESVTYTNTGASAITVYPEVIVYATASASPYTLALSYVTPPPSVTYNEVEANNSIAAANAVPATSTKIVGYIGSSTDNDYFAVAVGAGRTLSVGMTGPTGSSYDYDLYFYNAAGTSLASGTGSTTTENVSWTNGATATTVYVAVKRYKGSSTTTPYNLNVSR